MYSFVLSSIAAGLCYTPPLLKSSALIWSLRSNNTMYHTTFMQNLTISNQSCFRPGITGDGHAMKLSANLKQYFIVDYFFDFRNINFSISAWIYLYSLESSLIFMQCKDMFPWVCISVTIQQEKIVFNSTQSKLYGRTSLRINRWYHFAVVYNDSSQIQILYLDGIEDGRNTSTAYTGSPNSLTIGGVPQKNTTYFDGLINRLSIIASAMTATEVHDEATLSIYYSFDSTIEEDSGPNQIEGVASNVGSTVGIHNQSLSFLSNSTFIAQPFLLLGGEYSFSISFWLFLNHSAINGTFISIFLNDGWYIPLFGFNNNSEMIVRFSSCIDQPLIGPSLPLSTWSYITMTYDGTHLRLYRDEFFVANHLCQDHMMDSVVAAVILGFLPNQIDPQETGITTIEPEVLADTFLLGIFERTASSTTLFDAIIDEFQIYSRCLTAMEIQDKRNSLH